MYSIRPFHRTLSLAAILATLSLSTPVGQAEPADTDWDSATPSEIHQRLWESKAAARLDREFYRKLAAAAPAENTQTNYDVLFYDVNLRVDDTTQNLFGVVKIVAAAAIDNVGQVQVDFHQAMTVDSIKTSSTGLVYSRADDVVTVTLDPARNVGEQFEMIFYYHGHPTEGGFQGFSFDYHNSIPMISSLSEPYFARSWWPCKDRMDDKPDSMNIAVTSDTAFYVASNGTLDSVVQFGANAHTFYWSVRYPIATYLFSVAITRYTVWTDEWVYNAGQDTMPLVHAVYPENYSYSLTKYNITPYALTVLSGKYGQYPFVNEKYGHANFQWGGAMEHQTMTSTNGGSFGFSEPVVVHEMAHQWFGDMITCYSWGHVWLNEGWASYAEADYYLAKDGWAAYHNYMDGMAYAGGGTIYIEDADTTDVWSIFNGGLSYDKAAWVLHMLRGVLGDQLFYQGVAAYYNSQFKFGAATTEDFRDVFEAATGRDLHWFFEDWIYGEYRPNYNYRYVQEVSDSGGYDLYLLVDQTQTTNPQVFRMPVDFFFDFATLPDDTVKLWCNKRQVLFHFNLPDAVNDIQCDPAGWVLKYASEQPWQLHFVTTEEDLSAGVQYSPYRDTVRAIGGSNNLTYSLVSGSLPNGYSLDADGVISGTTPDTGQFVFTARADDDFGSLYDEMTYSLDIGPAELIPGDVDLSFTEVDVSDLIYLVDFMFSQGPAPQVLNLADVNGDCSIDISDLVYLVDYMFNDGPQPVIGCVVKKTAWPSLKSQGGN